ncbi:MAG: hypothetical protein HQK77_13130 [Desulfobacterales bacterium]|nr:hypothetical protein [Desulfobacterales bacterium]
MQIQETTVNRILNPTSINLGDYVINPYKGCVFACAYCYARQTKSAQKDPRKWGDYVDVRINAISLLQKELRIKRPKRVLLGSITECFQPIEQKYHLTSEILHVLNTYEIPYAILTRSPMITDAIPLLRQGFCHAIYFTINHYPEPFELQVEPRGPKITDRVQAILSLFKAQIPVIPYCCPILPEITTLEPIFSTLSTIPYIEFEAVNFSSSNHILEKIAQLYPNLVETYTQIMYCEHTFTHTWQVIANKIQHLTQLHKKKYELHLHPYQAFFNNRYNLPSTVE